MLAHLRTQSFAWLFVALSFASGVSAAEADRAKPAKKPLPAWQSVERACTAYFQRQEGYQRNDLVWRSRVEPLFDELARLGWSVDDRASLLAKLPGENDTMVVALRSPDGQKLMRKIATVPLAFDRLDRMARLERGARRVQDLVNTPKAEQVFRAFNTTGGAELARRMTSAPGGRDFERPTGRIYTAEQLLAALKKSYAAAAGRRAT
jgi:hypothetical protein